MGTLPNPAHPTACERQIDSLAAAVARVRKLHRRIDLWMYADSCDCADPATHRIARDHTGEPVCVEPHSHLGSACAHCQVYSVEDLRPWPCPTIQALGDTDSGGDRQ